MEVRSNVTRVKEIASQAVEDGDIELVHVEMAGIKRDQVIRVYIDKQGGVTLDDCSLVSHKIEAVLDAEDFIPSKYVLEVSSPGIERQLYSREDFVRFTGQLAKVKLKREIAGQKTFVGIINAVDGAAITFADRTVGELEFDYSDVEKANLKIDLSKEFGGKRS
ncbi:MAG: ribosome maturation factor RimP [Pyrinomonadaceae bacterium]